MRTRRYDKTEFARRGDDLYDSVVRARVEPAHNGEIVAIDIKSGDWEVGPDEVAACARLEQSRPDAQIWFTRVGSGSVRHFGGAEACH